MHITRDTSPGKVLKRTAHEAATSTLHQLPAGPGSLQPPGLNFTHVLTAIWQNKYPGGHGAPLRLVGNTKLKLTVKLCVWLLFWNQTRGSEKELFQGQLPHIGFISVIFPRYTKLFENRKHCEIFAIYKFASPQAWMKTKSLKNVKKTPIPNRWLIITIWKHTSDSRIIPLLLIVFLYKVMMQMGNAAPSIASPCRAASKKQREDDAFEVSPLGSGAVIGQCISTGTSSLHSCLPIVGRYLLFFL